MIGVIAVVDIPKNCAGCDYSRYIGDNFRCVINDTSVREHVSYQTKPKWCPIKAYDIDEIVKQLEGESWSVGCSFASSPSKLTQIIKTERAIEIVREGGAE